MNHYTYEIEFENGMKYIGVRSCKCPIDDDNYLGSSKVIPPELYVTCNKTILGVFDTRVQAVQDEIRRHEELDIANNPLYYNQVKQTAVGFDQSGTTKETHKHVQAMADKLKGRTVKDYQYLAEGARKSQGYRGLSRTPKQLEADEKLRNAPRTTNPAKGNIGDKHPRMRAWYFITPEGEYNEIHTSIRDYFNTVGFPVDTNYDAILRSARDIGHRAVKRGPLAGYIFGYLDTKPEYLTQENIIIALQVLLHLPVISPNITTRTVPEGYNPISNITGKK